MPSGNQSSPGERITREAARDLSDYQYHAMKLDTNGRIDYCDTSNSEHPIGILQNEPEAQGEEAEVVISGTSKFIVTGSDTISQGDLLGSDSSYHGKKVTSDKDCYFVSAMEDATADGDQIEVNVLGESYLAA